MADRVGVPQDELGLLKFLDALEDEGRAAREYSAKHWDESIRQLRGDQWRMARNPHFTMNIIRNQVERKVSALTEVKPTLKVSPTKQGLDNAAQIMNQSIKALWDMQQVDQTLHRLCVSAMTLGSGFLTTYWDPAANNYTGEIMIRMIDPRKVIIDPGVTEAEHLKYAAYVMTESFDTLNNIRMRYPGRGLLVKPDKKYSSQLHARHQQAGRGGAGILSAVMRSMPTVFRNNPVKEGPIARAEIREYWVSDPQLGQDGQPAFPTGRHIIRSGDVILRDEVNPFWDGMWPIDMMDWNMDFDSPWGLGEVQELRRIQEAFNRIGDGLVRNSLLSNNVKVIADMDALEPDKWDELTNEGGIVIKKRPGREITYDFPREMPQYLFQLMTTLINFAEMSTGNLDVSGQAKGGQGGNVISASALEGIQAQSQLLIRAVARRLEGLLERIGQKLISRILQFYTHDRVLHLLGPTREWISYTFERNKVFLDDQGQQRKPLDVQRMFNDFKFLVVPGSSLATTRVQRTMMALNLKNALQIVPSIKTILREADLGPDPEEMIEEGIKEMEKYGKFMGPQDKKKKS